MIEIIGADMPMRRIGPAILIIQGVFPAKLNKRKNEHRQSCSLVQYVMHRYKFFLSDIPS